MAGAQFKIVFDGQMVEGADPEQVRANLAKLFKTDASKVEHLFAGGRKLIRRDVDEATARKFQAAFSKAGAIAVIVDPNGADILPEVAAPPPPPPPADTPAPAATEASAPAKPPEPAPPPAAKPEPQPEPVAEAAPATSAIGAEPTRTELAEAGRAPPPIASRGQPSAPDDMTMADAGVVLVQASAAADAPDIDTSHLSLSEAGTDLGERKTVAEPQFDLSSFELAPPGTTIGE